jgi:hypothetical protein
MASPKPAISHKTTNSGKGGMKQSVLPRQVGYAIPKNGVSLFSQRYFSTAIILRGALIGYVQIRA